MRKSVFLLLISLLVVSVTPAPVSADMPSNAITVSIAGNGTWSGGTLSVLLSPGELKHFAVEVHNNLGFALHIKPLAEPGCNTTTGVTVCFHPTDATLVAGATSVFNLTIRASGATPPGVFSVNLTISTDTEPPPEPEPVPTPHHLTITSVQGSVIPGSPHDVTATVFDASNRPLAGVPVTWTIASGGASFSSKDNVTGTDGRVAARLLSAIPDSSVVRCAVTASPAIMNAITLAWAVIPPSNGGNGNDEPPPSPPSGLPAWTMALIFIAAIGGCIVGYIFYKRWRERKSTVDPLLQSVDAEDTLNLD